MIYAHRFAYELEHGAIPDGLTVDQDLRALTYLARRLRDETLGCAQWDEAGTFACLKAELAGQNLLISAQRVLAHATDRDAKTPGAIKRPFTPEPTSATARMPYDPRKICTVCNQPEAKCRAAGDHEFLSIERARAVRSSPAPAGVREAIAAEPRTWPKPDPHPARRRVRAAGTNRDEEADG